MALLVAVLALAALPAGAAGKVEELSKALVEDASYKVRVQAALLLGKLGDKAAVPALTRALGDENKTVRAISAQALGQLGDGGAREALANLAKKDPDAFVRGQAEKAVAMLAGGGAAGAGAGATGQSKKARIYIAFGNFAGGTKTASAEHTRLLQDALRRSLGRLPTVTLELPAGVDEKGFARSGLIGFLIDGNITQLDESPGTLPPETTCDVKVMVARWPSKSILMWTNAGAVVQAGSRPQDTANARRDCIEASAGQLGEDLSKFLRSQGV